MLYSLIIVLLVGFMFTLLNVFKKHIKAEYINKGLKVLVVLLFTLGVIKNFLNDNFIWIINGSTYDYVYYEESDIIQSLLRWGHYLSYVVLPCAVFFKNRTYKNFAVYFCFFVAIVELFFFDQTMSYFLTDSKRAIFAPAWIRYTLYMIELFICLFVPLVLRFVNGHRFNLKDKYEYFKFFGLLPLALLIVMPVYLPQSLFGFTDTIMKTLSVANIVWILVIFLITAIIYFAFRFKSYETRYSLLVFLALLLFIHYNSIYSMDLNAKRLPFQLCNLGAYLILIALLIKKQGFFNFVLLANVPGAAIALVIPDVSYGILSFWSIHFYIEHTWVFIIPILAVALRIFERPKKNAIKHFAVGYSIYFVACAAMGILFNSILYKPDHDFFNSVNYFYLFDNKVAGILTFLSFTRNFPITINNYTFYPIYMLLVYALFFIFCMIFNYVYKILMKVGDDHFHLRKIKINMKQNAGYYEKHNRKIPQLDYEKEGEQQC